MKEYIIKADFITEGDELVMPDIVSELIRCKDCKHFVLERGWLYPGAPDYKHCDMFMDSHSPWAESEYEPSEEDYCSRAERKEE